jgi:signal transduction histidine kinase/ActR/RegA family two-component response regulator
MPPAFELLPLLAASRADALVAIFVAVAGYGYCRVFLQRRGALPYLSNLTRIAVLALAVVGPLIAETTRLIIDSPGAASSSTLLAARAFVLGMTTLSIGIVLVTAARCAVLQAQLRSHAETERQLQEAKSLADEANRAKSDFLAIMSHEIRTPLNAVMGFANLLAETRLDESQRGYVKTITSEGARLKALINDVLDLTKMEKGHLVLERLPFAPAEIAHDVLRLFSARAKEKNVELRLEAHLAGPLLVAGDPLRFRQILVNLIDNAIKFTPTGTVTLFLAWDTPIDAHAHGLLRIRIIDTGIGIAPEKLKDLFHMFTQADSSTTRRFGGTGLGLAICQRLVHLMAGEISVQSSAESGSVFAVSLPFLPLATEPDAAIETSEAELNLGHPPRILVVDDMETNRFLMEVFLRRNGFEPELAAGGEEAVRLATTKQYDAILMDLQMPEVDGYTATQRIRAGQSATLQTPIIALTASIARGTREKCLAAGMNDHLTKPLDLFKFKGLLQRLIKDGRAPNV